MHIIVTQNDILVVPKTNHTLILSPSTLKVKLTNKIENITDKILQAQIVSQLDLCFVFIEKVIMRSGKYPENTFIIIFNHNEVYWR